MQVNKILIDRVDFESYLKDIVPVSLDLMKENHTVILTDNCIFANLIASKPKVIDAGDVVLYDGLNPCPISLLSGNEWDVYDRLLKNSLSIRFTTLSKTSEGQFFTDLSQVTLRNAVAVLKRWERHSHGRKVALQDMDLLLSGDELGYEILNSFIKTKAKDCNEARENYNIYKWFKYDYFSILDRSQRNSTKTYEYASSLRMNVQFLMQLCLSERSVFTEFSEGLTERNNPFEILSEKRVIVFDLSCVKDISRRTLITKSLLAFYSEYFDFKDGGNLFIDLNSAITNSIDFENTLNIISGNMFYTQMISRDDFPNYQLRNSLSHCEIDALIKDTRSEIKSKLEANQKRSFESYPEERMSNEVMIELINESIDLNDCGVRDDLF